MKINYQKETKSTFQLQRSSKLQKVLNDVFTKSSFSIEGKQVFVNVVYVDLSEDLKNAKVVIDSFGLENNEQKRELTKQLNRDFGRQIRGIISQKMQMKYSPEITFYHPENNEKEKKVLEIIEDERKNLE